MPPLLKYDQLAPEGLARMTALEHYLNTETHLEPNLLDLIRLARLRSLHRPRTRRPRLN